MTAPQTREGIDIAALLRADRDDLERWRRVHEEADRAVPLRGRKWGRRA